MPMTGIILTAVAVVWCLCRNFCRCITLCSVCIQEHCSDYDGKDEEYEEDLELNKLSSDKCIHCRGAETNAAPPAQFI